MNKRASTADTGIRRDVEPWTISVSIMPLTAGFNETGHDVRGYDISLSMMDHLKQRGDPATDIGETAVRESDAEFDTIEVGQ